MDKSLEETIKRVLSFKYHKVDVLPEDFINILLETQCVSTFEVKTTIEKYMEHRSKPILPESTIDYADRMRTPKNER